MTKATDAAIQQLSDEQVTAKVVVRQLTVRAGKKTIAGFSLSGDSREVIPQALGLLWSLGIATRVRE